MPGHLLAGVAFQVAQDDQRPAPLGQSAQLLIQPRQQFLVTGFDHGGFGHHVHLHLTPAPLRRRRLQPHRRLPGDTVKPVRHHLSGHDRRRLLDEYEEGGLERILGVVRVAKDSAAHAPHHRGVPFHQGGEGVLVPPAQEMGQQFPIGPPGPVPPCGGTEVLDDHTQRATRHPLEPRQPRRTVLILRQGAI